MLKLTFRQKLKLRLWQSRRVVVFTLLSLLALMLTLWSSNMLLPQVVLLPLVQLAAGALISMLVIVLCD